MAISFPLSPQAIKLHTKIIFIKIRLNFFINSPQYIFTFLPKLYSNKTLNNKTLKIIKNCIKTTIKLINNLRTTNFRNYRLLLQILTKTNALVKIFCSITKTSQQNLNLKLFIFFIPFISFNTSYFLYSLLKSINIYLT